MSKMLLMYEPSLTNHAPYVDPNSKNKLPQEHVECGERIISIYVALINNNLIDKCVQIRGRPITDKEIFSAHQPKLLSKILHVSNNYDKKMTDVDMYANQYTYDCVRLSAGSTIELTKKLINSEVFNYGLALVRPPGHHATSKDFMGFCYLNNVMISAIQATKMRKRVLVVDWDVHFGNGSSEIMKTHADNKDLMFFSIHRYDNGTFYPGSKQGKSGTYLDGRLINVGFNDPQGDEFYLDTFTNILTPASMKFKPDLILISGGFDAAEGDPLGGCHVTPDGYYQMTQILKLLCPKVVLVLEGGYNLEAISESCVACMQAFSETP